MLDCDFQHPIELIEEMIKKYSLGYEQTQNVWKITKEDFKKIA